MLWDLVAGRQPKFWPIPGFVGRKCYFRYGRNNVKRTSATEVVQQLWHPPTVRKLARELADLAADALLNESGPVRTPDSERIASTMLRQAPGKPGLATLLRKVQKASLHLSHPRFAAQQ